MGISLKTILKDDIVVNCRTKAEIQAFNARLRALGFNSYKNISAKELIEDFGTGTCFLLSEEAYGHKNFFDDKKVIDFSEVSDGN